MQALQKYTTSEIALHTSKKDCWLLIHGKVYDVTTFLEDHPGGEDVLLHASASGDATQAFEDVGHSSTATAMIEGYLIGAVEGYVAGGEKSRSTGAPQRGQPLQPPQPPPPSYSFMDYFLPLLVLAVAFGAWYYLTFYAHAEA